MAALTDGLRRAALAHPERIALVCEGRRTNYGTLWERACQIAQSLQREGIRPGERIAYLGRNSDTYFEALYGAMLAGNVMVPVNWRLAAPEVAAIVADAEARLLLVSPEFASSVASVAMPGVERRVAMDSDFAAWRAAAPSSEPEPAGESVAIQLYTSGTTGRPKGVMLTHGNFLAQLDSEAARLISWNQWQDGDVSLLAMPVSHISGSGWGIATLHRGATCHIQPQFDLEATFDAIERECISKIFLVPAALQMLVRHPRAAGTDFRRIREMGYGASPMPVALLRECVDRLGCGFVQFYGMTETTGTIVALHPDDHLGSPDLLRAAGRALPGVEIRVVDHDGRELPPGEVGEIVTRSPMNMAGYWKLSEETARTVRDGWLRTGDVGRMDRDGYLFILDRAKDMIVSGGENVYPAEVESALSEHPAVAEVAVIGIPDTQWGEAVMAVVVRRADVSLEEAELIDWSRARIAGFKSPKRVVFTQSLPRNASGKLLKRAIREPYWRGFDRQVN